MKYSENWLREWVNPNLKLAQLAEQLTQAGIEVEETVAAAEFFTGVIIGHIIELKPHPHDSQLKICLVDVGIQKLLQIVSGSENLYQYAKVAVALDNAILPNQKKIQLTTIKDVPSEGMLCSAAELGLAEKSEGVLLLPADAPISNSIYDYFQLNDYLLNLSLTPNRGDCLSIRGLAREIAAITQTSLTTIATPPIPIELNDTIPVTLQADTECPHYVGRIMQGINVQTPTPIWMLEKLRRAGTRSINIIVDVMNYVMYELGQPLHAFDLAKINTGIQVRLAKPGERLLLLDGSEKELTAETLIIADRDKPLAIAGTMGGLESGVTDATQAIFIESAYFNSQTIARSRQTYMLASEAAFRFERGVDPTMQQEAIERATQLILDICGGRAGPLVEVIAQDKIPLKATIKFTNTDVANVLGVIIADEIISAILNRLAFTLVNYNAGTWEVVAPAYRFDIIIKEDIVEEIARLYGYNNIPEQTITAEINNYITLKNIPATIRTSLAHLGYHEIISYSFIDKKIAQAILPEQNFYLLRNPISADMAIMRPSLLPGLLQTCRYNLNHQQNRMRLFEIGTCFQLEKNNVNETPMLGGLITGYCYPEQWGIAKRNVDFFDLKGDLEVLLATLNLKTEIEFKPFLHPALHPQQTAALYFQNTLLGFIGAVHPMLLDQLNIDSEVIVFEINLVLLPQAKVTIHEEISLYPEIRRDLAFIINDAIPAKEIQDTIKAAVGNWLKDVFIFDIYRGKGIKSGKKSIAIALILQDLNRTLIDEEVADLIKNVVDTLQGQLGAELRS